MIGSISKVRPCGHSHYYKYSTYKTGSDLKSACPNVAHDLDGDNNWKHSLHSMESLDYNMIFYNAKLNDFSAETPNLKKVSKALFGGGSSYCCNNCIMNWDNATEVTYAFGYSKLKKMPPNFNPKSPNMSALFYKDGHLRMSKENNYTLPYNEAINNATNLSDCFNGDWKSYTERTDENGKTIRTIDLDERYTFENLSNGNNCFYNYPETTCGFCDGFDRNLNFKNLKEAHQMFFYHGQFTSISSKEGFPKLSNGYRMFYSAPLKEFCKGTNFGLPSLSNGD
jgi:hypothetical protein